VSVWSYPTVATLLVLGCTVVSALLAWGMLAILLRVAPPAQRRARTRQRVAWGLLTVGAFLLLGGGVFIAFGRTARHGAFLVLLGLLLGMSATGLLLGQRHPWRWLLLAAMALRAGLLAGETLPTEAAAASGTVDRLLFVGLAGGLLVSFVTALLRRRRGPR
jgi:hypothetical protein